MALALLFHRSPGISVTKPSSRREVSSHRAAGVRTCESVPAGVHARGSRRACVSVREPGRPPAAAAAACPAPPPAQSPPPVALARPRPSPSSVRRLRVRRAARCTRTPPAGARALLQRLAPGAPGAPSQTPNDDEPRLGGRGEQVSAAAGLGGGRGLGRRTGRAGVGCGWPGHRRVEKGLCGLQHPLSWALLFPFSGRGGGSTPAPASPLELHKQSTLRWRRLPGAGTEHGGSDSLSSPDSNSEPAGRPRAAAPGSGGLRRGRAQVLAREAVARGCEAPGARPGGGAMAGATAPCRLGLPAPATRPFGSGGAKAAAGGPDLSTFTRRQRLRAAGRCGGG